MFIADRDYFKRIMAGAPFVISSPDKATAGGEPYIVFAAPLRGSDGKVKGALLCTLTLTHPNFLGNLGKARIGQDGYFALIESSDQALFVMHGNPQRIMTAAPGGRDNKIMAEALKGRDGTVEGTNSQGIEALRTYTGLRSVPWVLLAIYPASEAFAGLRDRRREVLLVGGVLFVVGSVLAWLMSGWLLRPLRQLRDVMDSHASDPGLPMPPASFGSAELATLVVAYNAQARSRREFEERLQASERQMQAIADNLPVLISHIDKDERYTFINATFKLWLGKEPGYVIGRNVAEVAAPENYALRQEQMRLCLAGQRVAFEVEADTLAGRKVLQVVYIPDIAGDGSVVGLYALGSDVTALKQVQYRLDLLVRSDTLTGLPNRYQFNETLPLALERAAQAKQALALMFLDIDHFKQINDLHGHAVGDLVLQEFAWRLRHSVRTTDMVARLAGDEFVVILEALHSNAEPQFIARKILAGINLPFAIGGRTLAVTTSVGIAFQNGGQVSPADLLARADAALYQAKADGRNRYFLM
jgi:diguanylate cyclase (GGDEF)-like protein/PAS domain S-box-containing protein